MKYSFTLLLKPSFAVIGNRVCKIFAHAINTSIPKQKLEEPNPAYCKGALSTNGVAVRLSIAGVSVHIAGDHVLPAALVVSVSQHVDAPYRIEALRFAKPCNFAEDEAG